MEVTVNLDPDAYSVTSAYAGAKGISLSAALSELVRRGEPVPEPQITPGKVVMGKNGYLVVESAGYVLTPEMVKATSEDELG